MSQRFYELADRIPYAMQKQFGVDGYGIGKNGTRLMAMIDREGAVTPGHWFISGAKPAAYKMLPGRVNSSTPHSSPLAKLVLVQREVKTVFRVIG